MSENATAVPTRRPRGTGHIYLRGKTWWCRYYIRGSMYEESCKTPYRAVADAYVLLRLERGAPWRDKDIDQHTAAQLVRLPDREAACQGRIGAISEMLVSLDLMNKGYEVFRPMSPHACCDIVAIKGKRIVRLEVKTGAELRNGTITKTTIRNRGSFDILATVVRGKRIIYDPTLDGGMASNSGVEDN